MGSTRCRVCGRSLRVLKSVDRGIGPVCWAKRHEEGESEEDEDDG